MFSTLNVFIKNDINMTMENITIHLEALDLLNAACVKMCSYLAGVDAAVEPSTEHVSSHMVSVNFWLPTIVMRNQSHSALLQSRVPL